MLIKDETVRKDVIKELELAYNLFGGLTDMEDLVINAVSDDVYARIHKINNAIGDLLIDLKEEQLMTHWTML